MDSGNLWTAVAPKSRMPISNRLASGLKELSGLEHLSVLNLGQGRERITGAGFDALRSLSNLTMLSLNGTNVTDAGLKKLVAVKSLTTLNLTACPRSPMPGYKSLPGCPIYRGSICVAAGKSPSPGSARFKARSRT